MADLGQTDTVRIAGGAFTVDSVADQKAETEHLQQAVCGRRNAVGR